MSSQLHLGAEIGQFLWIENLEKWDFDSAARVHIIIMHCYITVSNNDDCLRVHRIYFISLTSSDCIFVHNHRRHLKLYIFGKYSSRSFQKYIVLLVYDHCEKNLQLFEEGIWSVIFRDPVATFEPKSNDRCWKPSWWFETIST